VTQRSLFMKCLTSKQPVLRLTQLIITKLSGPQMLSKSTVCLLSQQDWFTMNAPAICLLGLHPLRSFCCIVLHQHLG